MPLFCRCVQCNKLKVYLSAEKLCDDCKEENQQKAEAIQELRKIQIKLERAKSVKMTQIFLDATNVERLRKSFIAFDVETTGLDRNKDRIIEVGAVLFVDGAPVKSFSSLINANVPVSYGAYAVNHISDEMLRSAPSEEDVYPQLIEFLDTSMTGDIIMCAHNATFDFDFLRNTFCRLGHEANMKYIDTLDLARQCVPWLSNYKQHTLEKYFSLQNYTSHRAETDAENCGKILCELLKRADTLIEQIRQREERNEWLKHASVYWEQGEAARKDGRFDEAFELYDKAKAIVPVPWFLYEGYAKAYRKLGDYESELKILNEGIENLGPEVGSALVDRREKLQIRLAAKEESQRIAAEKAFAREQRKAERIKELELKAQRPKKPAGRVILQMDDDGAVIREFESIAAAARETGINDKSIRCAANGTQRHAGGYCWKYLDSQQVVSTSDTTK